VEAILRLQDYLNIVFNASEDISGNRVQNISIVTPQGAFYYATDCAGFVRENAVSVHLWATKQIEDVTNSDLAKLFLHDESVQVISHPLFMFYAMTSFDS